MLSEVPLLFAARRLNAMARKEISSDLMKVHAKAPEMRWLDLWASADLVPNGPLGIGPVHSYMIRNVGSPVDHVVYWRNLSEFITIVASQTGPLGGLGGPSGAGGLAAPRLVVAAMRRHARVMLLIWARIVVFAATLAAAVVAWETKSVGQSVIEVMGRIPLINELVKAPADWLVRGIGVGAAVAAGGLFWVVCGGAWGRLAGLDDETYFTAAHRQLWQPAIWIAVPAACVAMPVVATLALWSFNHHMAAWVYALSMMVLVPLALTVLSGGGVTLGNTGETHTLRESARRIVPREVLGNLIVAGLIGILVAWPITFWLIARTWEVPLVTEAGLIGVVLAVEGGRRYLAFAQLFARKVEEMPTTDTVGQSASSFERAP